MRIITKRVYRRVSAVFALLAFVVGAFLTTMLPVSAYTEDSIATPVADNISPSDNQSPGPGNGSWHDLIMSDHGRVGSVQAGLYFSSPQTTARTVTLHTNTGQCWTNNGTDISKPGNTWGARNTVGSDNFHTNHTYVVVQVNGVTIATITGDNLCGGDHSFTVPANSAGIYGDNYSSFPYRARLTVRWVTGGDFNGWSDCGSDKMLHSWSCGSNCSHNSSSASGSDDCVRTSIAEGSNGNGSNYNFRFRADSDARIGILANQENSIVHTNNGYHKLYYPFGVSCNEQAGRGGAQAITIYDADNGVSGVQGDNNPLQFFVGTISDGKITPLPASAYVSSGGSIVVTGGTKVANQYGDSNFAFQPSDNGNNGGSTTVSLNGMSAADYVVVIDHINDHQFINVKVPADEIYGDPSVSCHYPTASCSDSLVGTVANMWPGESGKVGYTVRTQYVPGTPAGSITGAHAGTNGTLSASGSTLSGTFGFTVPANTLPGPYMVGGGSFASNGPGAIAYNATCSPASITIMVGYMPYFKAYGGDVQTGYYPSPNDASCYDSGGGIDAWNMGNRGANNYAGAGSQFGVDALGVVTGFASGQPDNTRSGAAFTRANGPPLVSPSQDKYGGSSGDTSTRRCVDYTTGLTDVSGNLKSNGILTNLEPDTYTGAGVVPTGDIANHYTLYVKGNLYLDHNITYAPGPYTLNSIPSFKLVVTGNIYIASTVTQLDGVYVAQPDSSGAGGSIYTCASNISGAPKALPVSGLSYSTCGSQLTVNGSFVAKKVYLLRTGGTLNDRIANTDTYGNGGMLPTSNAAEQFIYSPETWLGQASFGNPTPAAIISLPPVY